MKRALLYLWRHPRRTGFIVFNLVVVAALIAWGVFTSTMAREGIGAVPNLMLGYTGMALMIAVLIAGWIAWAAMVTSRHARLATPPASNATRARADG